MDFSFTEEQTLLRDSSPASWRTTTISTTVGRLVASEPGWRPEKWKAFARSSASWAPVSGGARRSRRRPVENMMVMEEFGRALVVEPYLAHGRGRRRLPHAWRQPTPRRELIGEIIGGDALIAFAYAEPQGRYNLRRPQDDRAEGRRAAMC